MATEGITFFEARMLQLNSEKLLVDLEEAQRVHSASLEVNAQELNNKDNKMFGMSFENTELRLELLDWRKRWSVCSLKLASLEEDAQIYRENMQAMSAQLAASSEEKALLDDQLAGLRFQVQHLQSMQSADRSIQQGCITSKDHEIQRLEQQVATLHRELQDLLTSRSDLHNRLLASHSEKAEAVAELTAQVAASKQTQAAQKQQLESLSASLASIKSQLAAAEERAQASQAASQAAQKSAEHERAAAERLRNELSGREAAKVQMHQEREQHLQGMAEERLKIERERLSAQHQAVLQELRAEVDAAVRARLQAEQSQASLRGQLHDAQQHTLSLQEQLTGFRTQLSYKDKTIAELEEKVHDKEADAAHTAINKFLTQVLPASQQHAGSSQPTAAPPLMLPGPSYNMQPMQVANTYLPHVNQGVYMHPAAAAYGQAGMGPPGHQHQQHQGMQMHNPGGYGMQMVPGAGMPPQPAPLALPAPPEPQQHAQHVQQRPGEEAARLLPAVRPTADGRLGEGQLAARKQRVLESSSKQDAEEEQGPAKAAGKKAPVVKKPRGGKQGSKESGPESGADAAAPAKRGARQRKVVASPLSEVQEASSSSSSEEEQVSSEDDFAGGSPEGGVQVRKSARVRTPTARAKAAGAKARQELPDKPAGASQAAGRAKAAPVAAAAPVHAEAASPGEQQPAGRPARQPRRASQADKHRAGSQEEEQEEEQQENQVPAPGLATVGPHVGGSRGAPLATAALQAPGATGVLAAAGGGSGGAHASGGEDGDLPEAVAGKEQEDRLPAASVVKPAAGVAAAAGPAVIHPVLATQYPGFSTFTSRFNQDPLRALNPAVMRAANVQRQQVSQATKQLIKPTLMPSELAAAQPAKRKLTKMAAANIGVGGDRLPPSLLANSFNQPAAKQRKL